MNTTEQNLTETVGKEVVKENAQSVKKVVKLSAEEELDIYKNQVKEMQEQFIAQQKQIDRLAFAADQRQLQVHDAKYGPGEKFNRIYRVHTIGGKCVVGLRMVSNKVETNALKNSQEVQQVMEVTFEDKSTDLYRYNDYFTGGVRVLVDGECVSERKDEKGDTYLTLVLQDGKKIEINSKIVN